MPGALTPSEAHALMQAGAKLVDVRTQAELYWVGRVPGSVYVEWNTYPGGTFNADFLAQLAEVAKKDEPVMFLCRSGGRSHFAAVLATQAGYAECYNVLEGFEGDKDARGQRNVQSTAGAKPGCPGPSPDPWTRESGLPVDPAAPGGGKHSHPKSDAIPRERLEVVRCDVTDQPAHAQPRRDERNRKARREGRHVRG